MYPALASATTPPPRIAKSGGGGISRPRAPWRCGYESDAKRGASSATPATASTAARSPPAAHQQPASSAFAYTAAGARPSSDSRGQPRQTMNERWKEAAISSSSASGSCGGPASRSSAKRGSVSAAAPKQQSTPGRTTSHVESESAAATSAASLTPPTDQKVTASIAHALATRLADRVRARRVHRAEEEHDARVHETTQHALTGDELVRDAGERRGGRAHERHRERRQLRRLSLSHARNFGVAQLVSSSASSARTPRPAASTLSRP